MLPPELQGGPPPEMQGGPPPAEGLPPEIMALMGGGGMPPEPPMGDPAAGGESTVDILERMIEDAKLYIDTDEDEEDKHTMTKVLTILQGYLADEQKESQNAMQGKLSPKVMARAYGGQ